ncbi:MAG TPA: hypothetical protein VHH92_03230 [Actinomycetota bacterium]|nr:hypothetical protein [Actinomycetota bacterium]
MAEERSVMLYLDTPVDGTEVPRRPFLVAGWALDTDGPLVAVMVGIDRRRWAGARLGVSRPDVRRALPNIPGADRAGWQAELDLTDWGRDEVEITVVALTHDRAGRWEMPARVRLRPPKPS